VKFQDDASTRLVDDLRRVRVQRPDGTVEDQLGPYVEPVQLQVVCYRLWENLDPQTEAISERDVLSIGNVDTALGDYYSERVTDIAKQAGISERAIREWFNRKLISEQGVRGQVLMGAERSEGLPNPVIRLLENAYLVRAEKRGGSIWFELSHDRLIKPVQENNAAWLNANLVLLQRQTSLWEERDHNEALLLREKALDEAEAWAAAHADEMTPSERSYLKACQENRNRESEAKALVEKEIQLQEQGKAAGRLRRRAYGLAAALLVTLVLTVVAVFLGNQASKNATVAEQNADAARVNLSAAETANVNEAVQRQTAVAASTRAVAQQGLAETASTQAVAQAAVAQINLRSANTAEALAQQQKSTAQAASTQVAQQAATAQAASTQAVAQSNAAATAKADAERERDEAERQRIEAERQRKVALSRGLADSALASNQNDLSLLLSIEAYHITHTIQAENALLTGLVNSLEASVSQAGLTIPPQDGYIYSTAISRDGAYIAWGCDNGTLVVWDAHNERQLWRKTAHDGATIYSLKFSPDGHFLATGGRNSKIDLWDAKTGDLLDQINTSHGFVLSLDFSPDGRQLASSGLGKTIWIWTLNDLNNPRAVYPRVGNDVWAVAWSPNGSYLASAGDDRLVWIWDTATWNAIMTLKGHEGSIVSLSWSPGSQFLASAGEDKLGRLDDKTIFYWDMATGAGKSLAGPKDKSWGVAFSPDGKLLATGGTDKSVILWDTKTLEPVSRLNDHTHWVTCLAFNRTGRALLTTGGFDKAVIVYELRAPELLTQSLPKADGSVQGFYFSEADQVGVVSNRNGTILVSSIDITSSLQLSADSIPASASYTAVSRDGSLIAYGSARTGATNTVRVTASASGEELVLIGPLPGTLTSLAFSHDNQTLAAGVCLDLDQGLGFCGQPQITLWSVASGEQTGKLPPDSLLIQQTALPDLHSDSVLSLAFDFQGKWLASGGKDGRVLLWHLDNSEPPLGYSLPNPSPITAVAFSQDGAMLIFGTAEGKLYLWDMAEGRLMAPPLTGILGAVTSLEYSPDQKAVVSGSDSGQVLWWTLSPAAWIEKACAIAGRNLTQAEWNHYFPGEPYRVTCPAYPEGE
jgi:WD40 repeat protein